MTATIEELRAEREVLRRRLEQIEDAINAYESWEATVRSILSEAKHQRFSPTMSDRMSSTVTEKREPCLASATQTPIAVFNEKARQILQEARQPLNRTQMMDALAERGVVIAGTGALNTLASRLTRMEHVTNLKGFGYWLETRDYMPANYRAPRHSGSASTAERKADAAVGDEDMFPTP